MTSIIEEIESLNEKYPFAVLELTKHRIMIRFYPVSEQQYYVSQGFDIQNSRNELLFTEQYRKDELLDFIDEKTGVVNEIINCEQSIIIEAKDNRFSELCKEIVMQMLMLSDEEQIMRKVMVDDSKAIIEIHDEYCELWREEEEANLV